MTGKRVSITFTRFIAFILVCLFCVPAMMMAQKNVVIEAMTDEMKRSMSSLQIKNMEKPYFLEYMITDNLELKLDASFGSLTVAENTHNRQLRVGIRVGDYLLDNSGFMGREGMFSMGGGSFRNIVTEDDYDAIRHDIWLETDEAYKDAVTQLASKNALIKNQAKSDEEQIPDFSKEKKHEAIAGPVALMVDQKKWESAIRNLSNIFRKFPTIYNSGVEMQMTVAYKHYVNSEGTVFSQPQTIIFVVAYASTQAADGSKLKHFIPFYATTPEGLPSEKEMNSGVMQMATELTALAAAPVMDNYIGPVMFTGQASGELFAQILVPHFSGKRLPLLEEPRMAQMLSSSQLAGRLDRKVLSSDISITDDPTLASFEGKSLIGSYKVDDEGVMATPVKLVEGGTLKSLLMSRRPCKEITNSNGHARAYERQAPDVSIGNLIIKTEKGKSFPEMKKELIALCNDQKLPFGLIVKYIDNPALSGMDFSFASLVMRNSGGEAKLSAPILLYKVHVADGREELVRGLSFSDITVKSLKDIEIIGSDNYVHHRVMAGSRGPNPYALLNGQSQRGIGVPVSLVAPSVLFEELELKKDTDSKKNPPLAVHPFFRKGQ